MKGTCPRTPELPVLPLSHLQMNSMWCRSLLEWPWSWVSPFVVQRSYFLIEDSPPPPFLLLLIFIFLLLCLLYSSWQNPIAIPKCAFERCTVSIRSCATSCSFVVRLREGRCNHDKTCITFYLEDNIVGSNVVYGDLTDSLIEGLIHMV